jgi:hypothetical protein
MPRVPDGLWDGSSCKRPLLRSAPSYSSRAGGSFNHLAEYIEGDNLLLFIPRRPVEGSSVARSFAIPAGS